MSIYHSDIKPGNIMVTKDGEPKLMDFGLAKMANRHTQLSKTGEAIGTPAYMSLGQAENKKIDAKSDVYSLGATLYDCLTGRPPFEGDHFNIFYQVMSGEPSAPRRLNPGIAKELEAICLKCLEKNPVRRYQSARELAEDLKNFRECRPTIARTTVITSIRKFIVQYWTFFLFIVVVILGLLATSIYFYYRLTGAEQKKLDAEKATETAKILIKQKEEA